MGSARFPISFPILSFMICETGTVILRRQYEQKNIGGTCLTNHGYIISQKVINLYHEILPYNLVMYWRSKYRTEQYLSTIDHGPGTIQFFDRM